MNHRPLSDRLKESPKEPAFDLAFLSGGGEMGALIRSKDWSKTPLGPVDRWPQSLKTAARIMLTSRQPIWIGWGEQLIKLYDDPYKAIVRRKHPVALGQPASLVWREIWPEIKPMLETAMGGIEGTYVESQLLIMERNGYPEEVIRAQKPSVISDLSRLFDHLPTGVWKQPPHQAVVVPIVPSNKTGKAGILIAGLNPFRLFDDRYQRFVDLVASQIAASIANAQRYEEERKRAEALAELDRAKTAFFSNVSHELRTPLTLMLGPLEELKAQFGGSTSSFDAAQYQQVDVVHRNGLVCSNWSTRCWIFPASRPAGHRPCMKRRTWPLSRPTWRASSAPPSRRPASP